MKITIQTGSSSEPERTAMIDNKKAYTESEDAVAICISALIAVGYHKDYLIKDMQKVINNIES